jgi:transcriptional regulator with XRE-family HTH domain
MRQKAQMNRTDATRSRKLLRWSQYVVYEKTGIERSRFSAYECGYVDLRADELERLESALRAGLQAAGAALSDALAVLTT